MKNFISKTEVLPEYATLDEELLRFGKNIVISRPVYPFKVEYLPFFQQLTSQITFLLKKECKKNFVKYFDFQFKTKSCVYEGLQYVIQCILKGPACSYIHERVSTEYRGMFYKLHKDGYAYGVITLNNKIGLESEKADIWIRWKSNVSGYEYIEPDDGLDLQENDINFELCSQIPDEFSIIIYKKCLDKIALNKWKLVLKNEKFYPLRRKKNKNISYEISAACMYPDIVALFYFKTKVTKEMEKATMSELLLFQEKWGASHIYGIHDMGIQKSDFKERNTLSIWIDFGSSDYKIIYSLIKWFESSKLDIEKILIK